MIVLIAKLFEPNIIVLFILVPGETTEPEPKNIAVDETQPILIVAPTAVPVKPAESVSEAVEAVEKVGRI